MKPVVRVGDNCRAFFCEGQADVFLGIDQSPTHVFGNANCATDNYGGNYYEKSSCPNEPGIALNCSFCGCERSVDSFCHNGLLRFKKSV